ncbi:MAG: ATP-binding protein [Elusimicrobiota bacterium]
MKISEIIKLDLIPRRKLEEALKWFSDNKLILITGSRQVGKTSLLYLLIKEIFEKDKGGIFYYDLEDFQILELLNSGVESFIKFLKSKGADLNKRVYVFLDEIQYLENPSNFLKLLVDHYKNIKIIASGSSTLDIKRKFKDSLVGRKVVFELNTLSFSEYLLFKKRNDLLNIINNCQIRNVIDSKTLKIEKILPIHQEELFNEFMEYINYGGYPAVVKEIDISKKIELINEIYTTYVRKDIGQLFSIKDIAAFNNLVKMISLQVGNLMNEHNLSTDLKINHATLKRYLFILENTFIIKIISPYFKNKHKEIIKMPKVYFLDSGLRNSSIKSFNSFDLRPDLGSLIENYVFCMINGVLKTSEELKFWRTKAGSEVDFIIELSEVIPVESKFQEMSHANIPSGLRAFIHNYNPKIALVVTKNYYGKTKKDSTVVYFIPVWAIGE